MTEFNKSFKHSAYSVSEDHQIIYVIRYSLSIGSKS